MPDHRLAVPDLIRDLLLTPGSRPGRRAAKTGGPFRKQEPPRTNAIQGRVVQILASWCGTWS